MTLNVDKNKSVLLHAYKEVLDERNPINWALFGYDGQTYDLNLVSKGDGDLEEMIEDFNSGKIQYALCRVKIKEKNVEKIVLINWQGEGAPLARKGMCANHLGTIKNFFKGVHVSLNARTDEDVEPDLILQMVSKAIAGEGIKVSSIVEPDIGPVGTRYKRVNPQEEINIKAKDDFWRKEEQEEEGRKRDESHRHRKFSVDEVKLLRKESQDYFDKEEQELAIQKQQNSFTKSPSPQPQHYNGISSTNGSFNGGHTTNSTNGFSSKTSQNNNTFSNSSSPIPPNERAAVTAAALQASTPMKNNSDLVRQRIKSFDGGSTGPVFPVKTNGTVSNSHSSNSTSVSSPISPTPPGMNGNGTTRHGTAKGNSSETSLSVLKRKQLFESGGASNTVGTVGRKNPAEEIRQAQEDLKKLQEKQEKKNISAVSTTTTTAAPSIIEEPKVISPTAHYQSSVITKSIPEPTQQLEELPPVKKETTTLPIKEPRQSLKEQQPVVQTYHEQHHAQTVQQQLPPQAEAVGRSPQPPKSPSPQPPEQIKKVVTPPEEIFEDTSVRSAQDSYAISSSSPVPPHHNQGQGQHNNHGHGDEGDTITIELSPDMGVCARALYDYQAADETEITFDPGDIIRNIEKIDEGWWEGLGPGDQYGLFPANYVELLN